MSWQKFICISFVIVSVTPKIVLAQQTQTAMPLTLSANQAVKLQQLFPSAVTEKDAQNANLNTSTEHLVWNKVPLKISLPLNQERMITFPENVQFGYDNTVLTNDVLSIQNVNGTVYLVAKKPFDTQRVFVQLKQSGELVLLDLSAKASADDTPLSIIVPQTNSSDQSTTTNQASITQAQSNQNENIDYTELSRFAIQQLYAPKRLLTNPDGIYRVPMHTTHTVPLMEGDAVIAMPLVSWRAGDEFITAVLLRNRLDHSVVLDPRRIRGQWKTAAFFPQIRLAAAGNSKDSTTVFLISDQPFAESLGA